MRVLISGAGIARLSLALRLRQRGLAPVVVERSPRLRDGGYMLGLSDPGLDAAERMGVADALRAARHMPRRLVYVDGDGRERFAIDGPAIERLVGDRQFNLLRGDTWSARWYFAWTILRISSWFWRMNSSIGLRTSGGSRLGLSLPRTRSQTALSLWRRM